MTIPMERVENRILFIRGHRVMVDTGGENGTGRKMRPVLSPETFDRFSSKPQNSPRTVANMTKYANLTERLRQGI